MQRHFSGASAVCVTWRGALCVASKRESSLLCAWFLFVVRSRMGVKGLPEEFLLLNQLENFRDSRFIIQVSYSRGCSSIYVGKCIHSIMQVHNYLKCRRLSRYDACKYCPSKNQLCVCNLEYHKCTLRNQKCLFEFEEHQLIDYWNLKDHLFVLEIQKMAYVGAFSQLTGVVLYFSVLECHFCEFETFYQRL